MPSKIGERAGMEYFPPACFPPQMTRLNIALAVCKLPTFYGLNRSKALFSSAFSEYIALESEITTMSHLRKNAPDLTF